MPKIMMSITLSGTHTGHHWKAIVTACQANDVRYYIVEQDLCQRDSLESAKISYENMRNMGLE